MFICAITGKSSKSGEGCHKLVVETRQVTYPNGSRGTEIVKEVNVSAEGLRQIKERADR